jgi:prepilin-type N-terminal cleavage/methylation domain-containing protein
MLRRHALPNRNHGVLARTTQRGMTLIEIMIVLAILALVMGLVVGPRVMEILFGAKEDIAKLAVSKLSGEAYPQWRSRNPGKPCPERLEELTEFMNKNDTNDPWGNPYKLLCPPNLPAGARAIAIVSFGEDGQEGTDDDIKSW